MTRTRTCRWKLERNQSDIAENLWSMKVTVQALASDGTVLYESQLCQLILDPSMRGSTLDQVNLALVGTPTPSGASTAKVPRAERVQAAAQAGAKGGGAGTKAAPVQKAEREQRGRAGAKGGTGAKGGGAADGGGGNAGAKGGGGAGGGGGNPAPAPAPAKGAGPAGKGG